MIEGTRSVYSVFRPLAARQNAIPRSHMRSVRTGSVGSSSWMPIPAARKTSDCESDRYRVIQFPNQFTRGILTIDDLLGRDVCLVGLYSLLMMDPHFPAVIKLRTERTGRRRYQIRYMPSDKICKETGPLGIRWHQSPIVASVDPGVPPRRPSVTSSPTGRQACVVGDEGVETGTNCVCLILNYSCLGVISTISHSPLGYGCVFGSREPRLHT